MILLGFILFVSVVFSVVNIDKFKPQAFGAVDIYELYKNKDTLLNTRVRVIAEPECSFIRTELFDYYNLHMREKLNQFKLIVLNFSIETANKRNLFKNDTDYYYNDDGFFMISGEQNCLDIISKIADVNYENKVVIEGILRNTSNINYLYIEVLDK